MRLVLLVAAPLLARDFAEFAADLHDLNRLARIEGGRTRMESSWDRTGANDDGFRADRLRNGVYTIAHLAGPGVVRRFYSARPNGRLRIVVDDRTAVDLPASEFFSGKREPFLSPAVGPMGGGSYSYFPIPFARSLRIETTAGEGGEAYGVYYQVTYETFAEPVQSLALPLSAQDAQAWRRALDTWRNLGHDPKPAPSASKVVERDLRIAPGQTAAIDLSGPASLDELRLALTSPDDALLRALLLRIRWDGQERYGVDTPVGDFFGNAYTRLEFRSLALGLDGHEFYSYFAMPFARKARIELLNEHPSLTVTGRLLLRHHPEPMPANAGYFHAKWRRAEMAAVDLGERNTTGAHNYPILEVQGAGRYMGTSLNVWNRHLLWWGEGDPMIFVDDDHWPPSIHGTGTEETFNDAWGFHASLSPVSGVLLPGLSNPGRCFGPNAVFTFHFADSVVFRRQLRASIEHGTANNLTNDYSSTAFWYAAPGSGDFFSMRPASERGVPSPGEWDRLRATRIREFVPELKRQVREIAAQLDRFPTDADRHPPRIRVLRLVFQLANELGLDPAAAKRLDAKIQESRRRPLAERFPVFDEVFRDLARQFFLLTAGQ